MKKSVWISAAIVLTLTVIACGTGATPTVEEAPPPAPTATEATTTEAETEPTEESASEQEAAAEETFTLACVAVDPIEDNTWNYAHWQGCNEAAEATDAELGWIDSVPEGAEAERVIRDFAVKGYDLIFTTSFGFMDPTITVAEEFPDTWFVHISGYKTAPNVSTVFGRQYQAKYLAGIAAGAMTETCVLGLPAAHPFPEVIRLADAWYLGARDGVELNENCDEVTMKVIWTNDWYSPPLESEATNALIDAGADVIGHDVGTTKTCEVAQERGVYCVGYHTDFCEVADICEPHLTASIWDWGAKYTEIATAVKAGTYESESYWGGLQDGIVDIAPLHEDVPDAVRSLIDERRADIESGEWDVFCARDEPIRSQDGTERIAPGECLSDEELGTIEWFVEGIEGELQ